MADSELRAPDERECVAGTEQAGKAAGCAGCPNAQACAEGPKGPDPDVALINGEPRSRQARSLALCFVFFFPSFFPFFASHASSERMASVKKKILVLSGKGGVGELDAGQ